MEIYLNQTVKLKRVASRNAFGEKTFEEKTIRVRFEEERRMVRNEQGEEVVSEARIFTVDDVRIGDVIEYGGREWTVIAVSDVVDLDGCLLYREVAV